MQVDTLGRECARSPMRCLAISNNLLTSPFSIRMTSYAFFMSIEMELTNIDFMVLINASASPRFTTIVVLLSSARTTMMGQTYQFVATNWLASHHDGTTNFGGCAVKGGGS